MMLSLPRTFPMPASILIRSLLAGTALLPPLALGPEPDGAPAAAGIRSVRYETTAPDGQAPAPGQIAEWAVASGDNGGSPFVVVDKTYGQVYVFDSRGELQALMSAPSEDAARRLVATNRSAVVYVIAETASGGSSFASFRLAAR